MNEVFLANFRCFGEPQTARLAPLTLLVGDNSTGKSSFLALIRALRDVALRDRVPDFKEPPYDLGSFDEIVHSTGEPDVAVREFSAGFGVDRPSGVAPRPGAKPVRGPVRFSLVFKKEGSAPVPAVRRIESSDHWIEVSGGMGQLSLRIGSARDEWTWGKDAKLFPWPDDTGELPPLNIFLEFSRYAVDHGHDTIESGNKTSPTDQDWDQFVGLSWAFHVYHKRLFASAPIRSLPRRTYDPARLIRDSEGSYVPMYLADLRRSNEQEWRTLKSSIEKFGRLAGLFDEIDVMQLGRGDGDPFQMRIRKHRRRGGKGPLHNLVDVGFGVSQALPIITELLRPNAARMFLLQQPEVHLHPSAQAALGSLFCEVSAAGQQLVVETHSDHLIDRVRMDVRDQRSSLRPQDVSLLFFERNDLDVRIHSLRFDDQGNVVGAPEGYRRFFMEETHRSVGL